MLIRAFLSQSKRYRHLWTSDGDVIFVAEYCGLNTLGKFGMVWRFKGDG